MRFLVVMDPLTQILVDRDTTFGFMLAAQARGHEVFACTPDALSIHPDGRPAALARPVQVQFPATPAFTEGPSEVCFLDDFDSVWMRKDPPVDRAYLHATLILSLARTQVLNRPASVVAANEKLYALRFKGLVPETMVTRDARQITDWLDARSAPLVVKPVDGHGGFGVFVLSPGDRNIPSILETLTERGTRWILAQDYLPAVREGDKRILLLNGEPVGAILRVPRGDEHRSNMHVGGVAQATQLTPRELQICREVGAQCRRDGLYFVGIDTIGDYLTEVNVTSPTGIREVKALGGNDLGDAYIRFIEAHPETR